MRDIRGPDAGRASPSLSFSMSKCRMILHVSTDTRCITCSDMCLARKAGAATHVCTSLDSCYDVVVSPWHTSQPASSRQSWSCVSRASAAQQGDALQAAAQYWQLASGYSLVHFHNGVLQLTCRSRLSTMAGSRPSTLHW
jgi:hypothetical protein